MQSNSAQTTLAQTVKPTLQNWLEAAAIVLIWTAFIVSSRMAIKKAFTPYDMMFLRFGFAALAAGCVVAWRASQQQSLFGEVPLSRMLFLGAFGGLGMSCIAFLGFSFSPAAHAAVLMPGTLPFSTAILAWAVLGEKIAGRKAVGLGLILLGVLFMAYQAFYGAVVGAGDHANVWKGDVLFPMASSCWAVYSVYCRKWAIKPLDAIVITPIVAFIAFTPFYIALAPKMIGVIPLEQTLLNGAFQGWFAFMLSTWLFMRVMRAFGPLKTTMLTAWAPALSALIAVPLLGEPLSFLVVAGLVAVSAGTVVGVLPKR